LPDREGNRDPKRLNPAGIRRQDKAAMPYFGKEMASCGQIKK
jgi:hypothetical protein